ncbi:hypothetical protein [Verrucosispora sp. TAA-831]|uniref:hypothetical protein n=1 Tax=Verrucosispora sp. TAA-831 TaxID=3422227 RepID=UPI003D6F0C14
MFDGPTEDDFTRWNEHNAHAADYDPREDEDGPDLIGPLTAEEWCAFRLRNDGDLLQCCGVTSAFRDALFNLLRMGGERHDAAWILRDEWQAMEEHGMPQGTEVTPLLDKLRAFYIDQPEQATTGGAS